MFGNYFLLEAFILGIHTKLKSDGTYYLSTFVGFLHFIECLDGIK